jgi:4-diphosphocytidyl-2C-methyl-D-erythritol kinase
MAPRRTGAYAACLDEALAKSGPACKSFELEAIPSSVGNLPQRLSGSGSTELAEVDSTELAEVFDCEEIHAGRVCSLTASRHRHAFLY